MKKLATIAMLVLMAGPACAQPTSPAPKSADSPRVARDTTAEARVDQRITQMHQRLKITPAQEGDWDAFAKVMRDNVTTADQAYKDRAASIATMSAPDNMRNFAQIEQDRAQRVQTLAASFQTLYDKLSDDQKKTADAMFRHYEDRGAARKPSPK